MDLPSKYIISQPFETSPYLTHALKVEISFSAVSMAQNALASYELSSGMPNIKGKAAMIGGLWYTPNRVSLAGPCAGS